MLIKKIFQGEIPENKILNTASQSQTDTYSCDYINNLSPDLSNYLAKNNTTAFTPSGDYNPATKKYVDSKPAFYEIPSGYINYPDTSSTEPSADTKLILKEIAQRVYNGDNKFFIKVNDRSDTGVVREYIMTLQRMSSPSNNRFFIQFSSGYTSTYFYTVTNGGYACGWERRPVLDWWVNDTTFEFDADFSDDLKVMVNSGSTGCFLPTDNDLTFTKQFIPKEPYHPVNKWYLEDKLVGKLTYVGHYNSLQEAPSTGQSSGSLISPTYTITSSIASALIPTSDSKAVWIENPALSKAAYYLGTYEGYYDTEYSHWLSGENWIATDYPEIIDGVCFNVTDLGTVNQKLNTLLVHVNASAEKPVYMEKENKDSGMSLSRKNYNTYKKDTDTDATGTTITEPSWIPLPLRDGTELDEYDQPVTSPIYTNIPNLRLKYKIFPFSSFLMAKKVFSGSNIVVTAEIPNTIINDMDTFNYNENKIILEKNPDKKIVFFATRAAEVKPYDLVSVGQFGDLYYVDDNYVYQNISRTNQYTTMPIATADTVGNIIQYAGITDNNYTNGYFYVGISETTEEGGETITTYSWSRIDVQPTVDLSNYLAKDNTTSYTPSADYNPATKKYVDDASCGLKSYYDSSSSSLFLSTDGSNPMPTFTLTITCQNTQDSVVKTYYTPKATITWDEWLASEYNVDSLEIDASNDVSYYVHIPNALIPNYDGRRYYVDGTEDSTESSVGNKTISAFGAYVSNYDTHVE